MSKAKSKSSKLNLDLKINSEWNYKLKNEIKNHNFNNSSSFGYIMLINHLQKKENCSTCFTFYQRHSTQKSECHCIHGGIHCNIICQNIVSSLLQLHCREFPHLIIRSSLHSCFVFYGLDVPELNIAWDSCASSHQKCNMICCCFEKCFILLNQTVLML